MTKKERKAQIAEQERYIKSLSDAEIIARGCSDKKMAALRLAAFIKYKNKVQADMELKENRAGSWQKGKWNEKYE